jgi:hypothetical protein
VSSVRRTIGNEAAYRQLLEEIAAGARLHYEPDPADPDPDLALLEGDRLYASGLSRLAELGDLQATAELADVISLVAQARAAGDGELAQAVWEAGLEAVAWGGGTAHEAAKTAARAGSPDAAAKLLAGVRERRPERA